MRDTSERRTRRGIRFGLRALLLATLLVATYCAGWQSHKRFHNRNLDENIAAALHAIDTRNVEYENAEKLGTTTLKGKQEDVSAVEDAVTRVQAAAGQ